VPDPNPTRSAPCQTASAETCEPCFKDVFYPDLGSDQAVIMLARIAFQAVGFEIREGQRTPYHPVFVFKLRTPPGPPRFVRQRDLQSYLRQTLSDVGLPMPKDAPLVQRNGERLFVAFMLKQDSQQRGRRRTRPVAVDG
jgi:hypothetical protein